MKLSLLIRQFLFWLFLFTIARISFFFIFYKEALAPFNEDLIRSFVLGSRFDLRMTVFLTLPFFFLPAKKRIFSFLNFCFLTPAISILMLDIGFYSYLKSRLNASAFIFLKNPLISWQMVRESYPIWGLIILFIILLLCFIKIYLKIIDTHQEGASSKWAFVIFVMLYIFAGYGSVQKYPLRWSDAFFNPNPFLSQLSLNPLLYVIDTLTFKESEFKSNKHEQYKVLMTNFLKSNEYFEREGDLTWPFEGEEKNVPNVILVIMESLGHERTSLSKNPLNPTPELKKLANDSLHFTHFYTPTVATARSVFAAITSLPDISKNSSSTRNPFIINQHTAISNIKNHQLYYFIGGSANWGHIRGLLSHNLPNLKLFEEGKYHYPAIDVWGISDLHLFYSAVEELSKESKPFFATIQTAGFHRPYTIPLEQGQFEKLHVPLKDLKHAGFESLEEYNALRLADYSLGEFIKKAKTTDWFKNTVFVIIGDHGLPVGSAAHVGDWERSLSQGFHVPLLIYAPAYFKAKKDQRIASELDLMPTIAHMLQEPFKTRTIGRDLFDKRYDDYRAAFSYNWYPPHQLTLIDDKYYFEMIPSNQNGKLIYWNSADPNKNLKDIEPEKYQQMKNLAEGIYETSKYLMEHNPRY